ncbi:hypothetical protein ElyMa_005150100 [Elysia marginata]|uniref:Uncharacterized protein n=1 Tax=Elysia marginata TaxID=1093978 RepID=A0AAV4JRX6_9GAST|nr:hypothetical protein ElyMa_005150100 [Elysia marginata]
MKFMVEHSSLRMLRIKGETRNPADQLAVPSCSGLSGDHLSLGTVRRRVPPQEDTETEALRSRQPADQPLCPRLHLPNLYH